MSKVTRRPDPGNSPSRFTTIDTGKDSVGEILLDLAHVHCARWSNKKLDLYLDLPGPKGDYRIFIEEADEGHRVEELLLEQPRRR